MGYAAKLLGVVVDTASIEGRGRYQLLVTKATAAAARQAQADQLFRQGIQQYRGSQLRLAMLTTMEQHPDPRNWAAFTLMGAAE